MRLVSFKSGGKALFGALKDSGIVELGSRVGCADLKGFLARSEQRKGADILAKTAADFAFDDIEFLPPIPNPGKILCIGLNYEAHRMETNSPKVDFPQVFGRFADSLTPHNGPMWLPRNSVAFDFEAELAIIIGRPGRYIDGGGAFQHVAGYSCFNDGSIRDWQRHTTQAVPGKNFPKTGAFGPWMVTADEIKDPHALTVSSRLNGETMQSDSTKNLLFDIPRMISYCSGFTPLHPGDVIATGTPAGVGSRRTPQVFMKPGDVIEVEVSEIGCLRNTVVREPGGQIPA